MSCFWGCNYKITAANKGNCSPNGDVTVLLMKCIKCGDIETEIISGHWRLEQLGETNESTIPSKDSTMQ